MKTSDRCDFIDWLKAVGMFLIVLGHVYGHLFIELTQPIYPKQLGVAFFVFVMGWGLAREKRDSWQVFYNRLFPMYFWGLSITFVLSLYYLFTLGKPAASNYLPFIGGINVIFNHFPANPTSWFIGTYLHLLLLWVLLVRRLKMSLVIVLFVLLAEWIIRSIFLGIDSRFVGYMLTTNWLTIFVVGMYMKEHKDRHNTATFIALVISWGIFLYLWSSVFTPLDMDTRFPFRLVADWSQFENAIYLSLMVSAVYLINTLFAVNTFSRLPANRVVQFFSRNTIVIFILHMPVLDFALWISALFTESGVLIKAITVSTLYIGLALLSELLNRVIPIQQIKQRFAPKTPIVNIRH